MTAPLLHIALRIVILILSGLIGADSALASDTLSLPSRISSVRLYVASFERIPIATILAHPDRYQMRDIRIAGTVMAMQTETITNRLICGRAHELTTLLVADESGQIEVIDQGACGRNQSSLKAPMLKEGQQIDLLVLLNTPTRSDASAIEATIRFLDLV